MNITRAIKNIFFLLLAIFSGLVLVITTAGVTSGAGELAPLNAFIENTFSFIRTPFLNNVMLFVTNIGSPFVLSGLSIVLAIFLFMKRDLYDTLLYLFSITSSVIAFASMKKAMAVPRPADSMLMELTGWSFPSGHATVATAFFFVTAYTFFSVPKNWAVKIFVSALCIVAGLLVAFSRVYLGAHFALDVLAGVALGVLTVSLSILLFNIFLSEREWWRRRVRSL